MEKFFEYVGTLVVVGGAFIGIGVGVATFKYQFGALRTSQKTMELKLQEEDAWLQKMELLLQKHDTRLKEVERQVGL